MSKKKVLVLGFLFAMGMQSSIFCIFDFSSPIDRLSASDRITYDKLLEQDEEEEKASASGQAAGTKAEAFLRFASLSPEDQAKQLKANEELAKKAKEEKEKLESNQVISEKISGVKGTFGKEGFGYKVILKLLSDKNNPISESTLKTIATEMINDPYNIDIIGSERIKKIDTLGKDIKKAAAAVKAQKEAADLKEAKLASKKAAEEEKAKAKAAKKEEEKAKAKAAKELANKIKYKTIDWSNKELPLLNSDPADMSPELAAEIAVNNAAREEAEAVEAAKIKAEKAATEEQLTKEMNELHPERLIVLTEAEKAQEKAERQARINAKIAKIAEAQRDQERKDAGTHEHPTLVQKYLTDPIKRAIYQAR